jgi:hypothetical protein
MTALCNIEVTLPLVMGPGGYTGAVLSISKQEFSIRHHLTPNHRRDLGWPSLKVEADVPPKLRSYR